jgi:hypothetical protein
MSLSAWLQRRKETRRKKAVRRHKKLIKRKYGQGDDRQKAIAFFCEMGGREGISGLLERFMVNCEPSIRDEDEKQQLFDILVGFGEDVVPAIEDYINRKDAASIPVTWPLKVLAAVTEPREAVGVIVLALLQMGTKYIREPERKVLLVSQLSEYDDERVVKTLIPFLRDHRDEVQLEALAALERRADEVAREPMLELLVEADTPLRLRACLAGTLKNLGWTVKGYRKKVEEALPGGFQVDRSGRIKGRWANAPAEDDDEEG